MQRWIPKEQETEKDSEKERDTHILFFSLKVVKKRKRMWDL